MTHRPGHNLSPEMARCIDECIECHRVCLSTISHCLEQGGEHAAPQHIGLLQDCAQICATSADFMIRSSTVHGSVCAACAEVCRACTEDCERMGDDPVMRECADVCRSCAESCQQMAGAGRA